MRLFLPGDPERLVRAVRGPWPSKPTGASLVYGVITQDKPHAATSRMVEGDVVFSDGVATGCPAFGAGSLVTTTKNSRQQGEPGGRGVSQNV